MVRESFNIARRRYQAIHIVFGYVAAAWGVCRDHRKVRGHGLYDTWGNSSSLEGNTKISAAWNRAIKSSPGIRGIRRKRLDTGKARSRESADRIGNSGLTQAGSSPSVSLPTIRQSKRIPICFSSLAMTE